jgi:predicted HTH domain antitoxin
MNRQISITYPESLAFSLKMGDEEFAREMKKISLVKLYEMGKISSGYAAKLLGISRLEFLEMLGKYNVSYLFEGELENDLSNA